MGTNERAGEIRWEPPGPGPWEVEGAHFPKPMPRFGRAQILENHPKGFAEGTARYGVLLSHFEPRFVNGFWYQQPIAYGAPTGAKGPPPPPVLWLLTRLHPGMRRRIRAGAEAIEKRKWREDLERWDKWDKPLALRRHRELLAVEPAALDDGALAGHLADCERHIGAMILLHHQYTVPCCMPLGLFLSSASEWTGKPPAEILSLLRGSTPKSLGYSAAELEALAAALREDGAARAAFEGAASAAEALEGLRAAPGSAGVAAREFLDLVWHRAVSYDLSEQATGEMPEVLARGIRAAVAGDHRARGDARAEAARAAELRALVPHRHRDRFDDLLREARAVNRLRDERGLYAECWAIGIARRGVLELGRRLAERRRLHEREDAVELELAEMRDALRGAGPSADEVRARVRWREGTSVADAPRYLGGVPAGPPDERLLPEAARVTARALEAVISNLFKETERPSTREVVRGISVNEGTYEGTARLVHRASEFGRLRQGDVLVTVATAPYFNVVLPLLGAIVTDRGGTLCHAAIVAREYGIPGVVGTKEATRLIPDGARVRVDGARGEVTVLA